MTDYLKVAFNDKTDYSKIVDYDKEKGCNFSSASEETAYKLTGNAQIVA